MKGTNNRSLEFLHFIFEEIRDTGSLKIKETLLTEAFLKHPCILKIVSRTLNPHVLYGLTSKSYESHVSQLSESERLDWTLAASYVDEIGVLDSLQTLLLSGRFSKGDKVDMLDGFISTICKDPKIKKMVLNLIDKDLDIGVGIKLFNKCVSKDRMLDTEICMLCKPTEHLDKFIQGGGEFIISPKLDGHRVSFKFDQIGEDIEFIGAISRNGKPFHNYDSFAEKLKNAAPRTAVGVVGAGFTIDGEIINPKSLAATMTQARRKYDVDLRDVQFVMFDFYKNEVQDSLKNRLKKLEKFVSNLDVLYPDDTSITLCPTIHLKNPTLEEVWKIHDSFVAEGYEGAVIKRSDSPYEFKKSSHWVKVKRFDTVDLTVIGFKEHTKKPGTLGSLVCDYEGKELCVGSGFTDEDRVRFYDPGVIGKTVEVQYQSKTKNTLQFPVFVRFRDDKEA